MGYYYSIATNGNWAEKPTQIAYCVANSEGHIYFRWCGSTNEKDEALGMQVFPSYRALLEYFFAEVFDDGLEEETGVIYSIKSFRNIWADAVEEGLTTAKWCFPQGLVPLNAFYAGPGVEYLAMEEETLLATCEKYIDAMWMYEH